MHSQRQRSNVPRKGRLWTTSQVSLTLVTGLVSVIDPQITVDFEAKTGRKHLKTDTLHHTWCKGFISQSAAGNASPEFLAFGIGWFPQAMNAANLPPVLDHDGDYQTHHAVALLEATAATVLTPSELSTIDIESAGSRACPGARSYDVLVVAETQSTPSAGTYSIHMQVTCLWLI